MFGRLLLNPFVKLHPAHRANAKASSELPERYRGQLPDSLLALWKKHGLGFYGPRNIALLDPGIWQSTLDRWIVSPSDDARRIPIAMTPFGLILYYRKLSETEEDVASLDPHAKSTNVLSWSLADFFNGVLCDPKSLDALIPPGMLQAAEGECGRLAPGEVYEADQTLLVMQMLKISKVDALAMHKRLRDAVDPPRRLAKPETVAQALPPEHRPDFPEHSVTGNAVVGLYLSEYIDWFRLLALRDDGTYRLLFWRIHHQTGERQEIRAYRGNYRQSADSDGDLHLRLDIKLTRSSLGSDANDAELTVVAIDGVTRLLRTPKLSDIARSLRNRGKLGHSEYYFRQVRLDDPVPGYNSDGEDISADPSGLPSALRAHL